MIQAFSDKWAHSAVRQLTRRGVNFTPGLDSDSIDHIGEVFGSPVPDELALFLAAGVPSSPKWARWHEGPESVARAAREWIDGAFAFDIRQGQYWNPVFGERPSDDGEAVELALGVVRGAPPLIPIYGHRFLTTAPAEGPRAVLSVWQAVDSIFYGNDLADYFAAEFGIDRPPWANNEPPPVPVWEDLFDLFCEGL